MTCPSNTSAATVSIERREGAVQLSFTVPNSHNYLVERSPIVGPANWTPWYGGGGRGWPVLLSDLTDVAAYFYRVGIEPPLQSPPFILQDPQSQTVVPGATATFSVEVGGSPPFSYQWFRDGQPIPNANEITLTINGAQPSDQGSYSVLVSNDFGSATSQAAFLTVGPGVSVLSIARQGSAVLVNWTGPAQELRAAGSLFGNWEVVNVGPRRSWIPSSGKRATIAPSSTTWPREARAAWSIRQTSSAISISTWDLAGT